MRVDRITTQREGGRARLGATVDTGGTTSELWFRWRGADCAVPGDPLLLASLPIAMAAGQSLQLDAPVSTGLWRELPRLQEILRARRPGLALAAVTVARQVEAEAIGTAGPSGTALWFDSDLPAFYAYQQHRGALSALVYLIDHDDSGRLEYRECRGIKTAHHRARELGKPLLEIESNLRPWLQLHGEGPWPPLLGSIFAHLLGDGLGELVLPAAPGSQDRGHEFAALAAPAGRVRAADGETAASVMEMARSVASDWRALEALRVCWENAQRSYNCGRCSKCTRSVAPGRLVELLQREARARSRRLAGQMNLEPRRGGDGATETA